MQLTTINDSEYWLYSYKTPHMNCLGNKSLPCCNVQMSAAGRCGMAAAPCANMCSTCDYARLLSQSPQILNKVVRFSYLSDHPRKKPQSISASDAYDACAADRCRRSFLCTNGTCTRQYFPQASPAAHWSSRRTNDRARHEVYVDSLRVRVCVCVWEGWSEYWTAEDKETRIFKGCEGGIERSVSTKDTWFTVVKKVT